MRLFSESLVNKNEKATTTAVFGLSTQRHAPCSFHPRRLSDPEKFNPPPLPAEMTVGFR